MSDPDLASRLADAAGRLGVALDEGQQSRLLRYVHLLDRWSGVYNLSAIRGPEAILQQHVVDCLAIVPPLARWAGGRKLRVLDVGSGAGLPGLVIAISEPGWSVTTVDAVGKKVAFVRQAVGELGLGNVEPLHGRVESLPRAAAFDVIVSRAFATLGEFTAATQCSLAKGGVWVAMKGLHPDRELNSLQPGTAVFHVEPLAVPGMDAARCLVWIRAN